MEQINHTNQPEYIAKLFPILERIEARVQSLETKQPQSEEEFLTLKQVADITGYKISTLYVGR